MGTVQATVFSFDPERRAGSVVTDDGLVIPFDPEAFAAGGVRLLRPGQRVHVVRSSGGAIEVLTVVTLDLPFHDDGDPA